MNFSESKSKYLTEREKAAILKRVKADSSILVVSYECVRLEETLIRAHVGEWWYVVLDEA